MAVDTYKRYAYMQCAKSPYQSENVERERLPQMLKLFEKLNNPIAVVLILATILAVNGFILYQQRSNPPEANAPEANAPSQTETPAEPSETGPERGPAPPDEKAEEDAKGDEGADAEDNAGGENANSEDNAKGDEPSENGSSNNGSSNNGSSGDEPQAGENGSNGSDGESGGNESDGGSGSGSGGGEPQNGSGSDGSGGDEPSSEGNEADSDEPDGDSGGGSQNGPDKSGDESGDGGAQGGQSERGDRGSGGEGGQAPLAGLGGALNGCEGDREGCVRDFVSRVSPDSRYIGGRMDLASGDSGRNAEVLYFEDPGMETCQYERGRHEAGDDLDYTVILVGPGSFNDERGDECIPTT